MALEESHVARLLRSGFRLHDPDGRFLIGLGPP